MKSISSLSYDYRGITLMSRYTPISIRNSFISYVISPYSLQAGSINYHRTQSLNVYEIRFVIFWLLFGSKCKFVQSCSSLHSFTLLHFDLKKSSKSNKANLQNQPIYKIITYLGFCYFTSDVIGLLIPFIETRKALADPNFKRISRRTGIWLLSSVTQKLAISRHLLSSYS